MSGAKKTPGVVNAIRHFDVNGNQLVTSDDQERLKIAMHKMLFFIKD